MGYILIIVILTFIDQFTKYYMAGVSYGEVGYSIPIIEKFFHLTYVENHGGIFGMFQGRIDVFTVASLILLGYIGITEYKNWSKYDKLTKIGICVLGSGALGNMIDRLFRGYVIDMIDFNGIWGFIFNVADVYVHMGIYIIGINYLINRRKSKNEKNN